MIAGQKSESPVAAGLIAEQNTSDGAIVGNADAHRKAKREFTLIAQAALAGHTLHRTVSENGKTSYTASRWGCSRSFYSLDAVEFWLNALTGKEVEE
jgi:hypothetical protein